MPSSQKTLRFRFTPDEESAAKWLEAVQWPKLIVTAAVANRLQPATREAPDRKPMPCWCKDCGSCFSVRTGTNIEKSRLKLRKREFAVCLFATNLKGVASTKLAPEIKGQQGTAWFMLHRPRESRAEIGLEEFADPVGADIGTMCADHAHAGITANRRFRRGDADGHDEADEF